MFGLFAASYKAQLDAYEDNRIRAGLASATWAGNLPSDKCREIEKRELKRGVLAQFMLGGLNQIGDLVLDEPGGSSPVPAEPHLKLDAIDSYTREVSFFEEVFDWSNISYIFAPYMYGRRSEWANLGVADYADAQFKAFLSAGAARVQVPVRLGSRNTRNTSSEGWASMRQVSASLHSAYALIAEDLAAEARGGLHHWTWDSVSNQELRRCDGDGRQLQGPGGY